MVGGKLAFIAGNERFIWPQTHTDKGRQTRYWLTVLRYRRPRDIAFAEFETFRIRCSGAWYVKKGELFERSEFSPFSATCLNIPKGLTERT